MIIGNEVGSIAKSMKNIFPKIKIGSVDLLGNMEMRNYSDYSFSVEKQVEDKEIGRIFQKPVVEYLSELGQIMSEENEFDYLIPLSPFNRKHDAIREIGLPTYPNTDFLKLNKNNNPFYVIKKYLKENLNRSIEQEFINAAENEFKDKRIFISTNGDYCNNIEGKEERFNINSIRGFWIPVGNTFASSYYLKSSQINKLGTMKLASPLNRNFDYNFLDKNSFISLNQHEFKKIYSHEKISEKICLKSGYEGIITIYFTVTENNVFIPLSLSNSLSCHFDLYINSSTKRDCKLSELFGNLNNLSSMKIDYYRIPYYCKNQIKVPLIDSNIATHRNIPKAISNPNYPICCLKKDF